MSKLPERLEPRCVPKFWGVRREKLGNWCPDCPNDDPIGEVHFCAEDLSVVLKIIATSACLSIQLHPDITEVWHVIGAENGATLACGFKQVFSAEEVTEAAASDKILQQLNWVQAEIGSTFVIRPGTVHTICGGVTICEIKHCSDQIFRFYDYGRNDPARPIEIANAVKHAILHECDPSPKEQSGREPGDPFSFTKSCVRGSKSLPAIMNEHRLIAILDGQGTFGDIAAKSGEVWLVRAGCAEFRIEGSFSILTAKWSV